MRLLLPLIAAALLAGCQIPPPRAKDAPQDLPGPRSIAYVPGEIPPPPGQWTTPENAHAQGGTLEQGCTVRICGLPIHIPQHVIELGEAGDRRVGDAVERRTRVGSLYGGPPEFIVTYRMAYQWGTSLSNDGGTAPDLWTNQVNLLLRSKPWNLFNHRE